jgi:acetate kinase
MSILTLNAGSTSLKFALFEGGQAVIRGEFENIDTAPKASAADAEHKPVAMPHIDGVGHEAVLPALLQWVRGLKSSADLEAIGHRVLHGGDRFTGPVLVTADVLKEIEALSPLAPLHQPHAVAAIRASQAADPALKQVACFDTAFHASLPAMARALPLPAHFGLRRYGFHGLSYTWISGHLPPRLAAGRTIVAHLGGGASLCAMLAGRSIETTMSTTPLDGLLMATRCGSLDPGVVLTLLQHFKMPVEAVEKLLYHEAGLLGVSGISEDMRELGESTAPAAKAAIDLFIYRIVQGIGSLAAVLEGLDGLVFTGGIGEHDGALRAEVCRRLGWLGVCVDAGAAVPGRISTDGSGVEVWMIATDEEAVIAGQVLGTIR